MKPLSTTREVPGQATLRLGAGFDVEYVTSGPRSGPAVVFVHGWPDSWRSFQPVIEALPPQRRCVAVSLRGFGNSDAPDASYSPRDLADDVAELIDHLGISGAVLVGHSLGSVVVQHIAVSRPDLVAGLVLVGGFGRLATPVEDEVWSVVSTLGDPIDEGFVREFQAGTLVGDIDPEFFDQLVAESRKAPARVWRAAWDGLRTGAHRSLAPRITAPTLLIWGDRDGLVPRSEQDALLAALPNARLEVYAGAGHSPNWEQPRRVAGDIEAWVRHAIGEPVG